VLGAGDLLPVRAQEEPSEREPRPERFDLRRELRRREDAAAEEREVST
jgi:hypothetical protein